MKFVIGYAGVPGVRSVLHRDDVQLGKWAAQFADLALGEKRIAPGGFLTVVRIE